MKTIELKGYTFELKNLEGQFNSYIRSDDTKLSDVYGKYSSAKEYALR